MTERPPNIKNLARPIIFVHLEKTAGTGFQYFLTNQIGSAKLVADPFDRVDYRRFFGDLSKKLYYGHIELDAAYASGARGYYLTILRSPLSRAFSQYSSWHNPANLTSEWRSVISSAELEAVYAVHNMSYQEFVLTENPLILGHIDNLMSKRLARDPWGAPEDLESAFDNLEKYFHWFGILEEFEKSMELLQASFRGCGPYIVVASRSNISEKYDNYLNGEAQQRIADLNKYDQLRYDRALELFWKRYANNVH